MVEKLRVWFPPVGCCLLLQAAIIGTGLVLHRCIEPHPQCCDSPLAL